MTKTHIPACGAEAAEANPESSLSALRLIPRTSRSLTYNHKMTDRIWIYASLPDTGVGTVTNSAVFFVAPCSASISASSSIGTFSFSALLFTKTFKVGALTFFNSAWANSRWTAFRNWSTIGATSDARKTVVGVVFWNGCPSLLTNRNQIKGETWLVILDENGTENWNTNLFYCKRQNYAVKIQILVLVKIDCRHVPKLLEMEISWLWKSRDTFDGIRESGHSKRNALSALLTKIRLDKLPYQIIACSPKISQPDISYSRVSMNARCQQSEHSLICVLDPVPDIDLFQHKLIS